VLIKMGSPHVKWLIIIGIIMLIYFMLIDNFKIEIDYGEPEDEKILPKIDISPKCKSPLSYEKVDCVIFEKYNGIYVSKNECDATWNALQDGGLIIDSEERKQGVLDIMEFCYGKRILPTLFNGSE